MPNINFMNHEMNLSNKLDDNLHNFENFHSEPFILFEKNNLLDSKIMKF